MKNNVKCVISFVAGAGLGVFGGYKLFEYKLKKLLLQTKAEEEAALKAMEEEIAEEAKPIEEEYTVIADDYNPDSAVEELNKLTTAKPSKKEKRNYAKTITKEKYVPSMEPEVEKGKGSDGDIDIIPAQDFDVIPGFDTAYWTLYEDGVMVDDAENIVESSMDYIGEEAYNALMSGEETVCVRNFTTKTDYKLDKSKDYYYDDVNTETDETID